MDIKAFTDRVLLPEKKDVLRIHLYFKMVQYGIRPYENDMDIILELYLFGGYTNAAQQSAFIRLCLEKGLKKSAQSVRNTLSKYVGIGIFDKPKNTSLHLSEKYIPTVECDKLMLQHVISHAS